MKQLGRLAKKFRCVSKACSYSSYGFDDLDWLFAFLESETVFRYDNSFTLRAKILK